MPTGKEIETTGHIIGFREEIKKVASQGKDVFFTWFDGGANAEMAFVRGNWDFLIHIAMPLTRYINRPEEKSILEIGYGGGRVLSAACRCFKKAIGIDVHDQFALVDQELKNRGATNFELLSTDGKRIPVERNTIDVIYSFIVLMHVEKIEIFKKYFLETYRALKPGGFAILYFGRQYTWSNNSKSKLLYWADCTREYVEYKMLHQPGYLEMPARVNAANLLVSIPFAKYIARKIGFQVLGKVVSHKRVPDGIAVFGGQHGLILRKNP